MNRFILLGLLATTLLFLLQSHQGQAASMKKAEAKAVVKKSASVPKKKTSSKSSDKKAATKYAKKATKLSIKSKAGKKAVSKVKKKAVSKDKKKAVSQVKKKAVSKDKKKAVSKVKKKAVSKDKKKAVSQVKKKAVSKDKKKGPKKAVRKGKKPAQKGKKVVSKAKKVSSKDKKATSQKKKAVGKDSKKVSKAKKSGKEKQAEKKKAEKVDKKDKKKAAKKAVKNKKKAAKKVDKKEKKKAAKKVNKKDKKKAAKKVENRRKKNAKVCLRRRVGYQCRTGKRVKAKSYHSCIKFCQNNKHCRSIDWNTKRRLCLLHNRAKRLHRTIHNIIHVAKVACNRLPGRVWPKKLIGKGISAPGGCMRRIRTLYTFSVRRVLGLATAVQCRYWCWKHKRCRYVDWDQRHRSCWTHGDLSKKHRVKPRRDIRNWPYAWTYVKIRCPWNPRWRSSRANIKPKGGRNISAVYKYVSRKGSCDQKTLAVIKKTKLQQCFRACDKEEKCLSFVYRKKDDDGDDDDDEDDDEPSYPRCYLKANYCPKLKDRDDDNVFTYNKALAAVTKLKLPGADKGRDAAKSMDPCKVMACPKGSICVARPKCDKAKTGGTACKVEPSCAKKISKKKKKNVACPGKKWKKVGDECIFTPFHMFNYAIKAFKKIEMRDNRKCPAGTIKRPGKKCKVMSHKALEKTFAADQEMSQVVSLKNVEMFIRVKPGENCPDGFGKMKGEKDACQVTDEEKVRELNRKARLKKGKKKASGADEKRIGKQKKKDLEKKGKKETKATKKKASRKSAKKESKNASKKGKKKVAKKEEKASRKGEKKAAKKGRKEKKGKKLSEKSNKKAGKGKSKEVAKEKGSKKNKLNMKSSKPGKKVAEKNSKHLKRGSRKSKDGKASSKKGRKKGGGKKVA